MSELTRRYHFLKLDNALDDLRNWYIRASRFGFVNDGRELQACKFVGIPEVSDINDRLRFLFAQAFGFLCMSKESTGPLLWERYGENNRGVCFGLDIEFEVLMDVKYVDECVDLPMSAGWLHRATEAVKAQSFEHPGYIEFHNTFSKMISTKFRTGKDVHGRLCNWEDEAECRAFIDLDEEKNGSYFANFGKSVALAEVILGSDCPAEIDSIREILKDRRDVTVRRHS